MAHSLVRKVARQLGWRAVGLVAAGLLLGLGVRSAAAQDQKLPKADEIIAKMIDATGGEAAMKKITNRVSKGTYEAGGMSGSMTAYEAAPNKSYAIIELPKMGTIEQGTNGQVYWERNPISGPRVLDTEDIPTAARHADFYYLLDWRKQYKSAETSGTATVNDQPAYKVVLTPGEGEPETWFINQKTNLLVRMDVPAPGGEGMIESYLDDYRKVDAVMTPFRIRQTYQGQPVATITWKSIEQNVDIPKDRFEPPPDIKELMKQAPGKPQPGQTPPPAAPEKPKPPKP